MQQAYGAGLIEAFFTAPLIYQHFQNRVGGICESSQAMQDFCLKAEKFVEENRDWILKMISMHCPTDLNDPECDPYWHNLRLIFKQLDGLQDMYDRLADQDIVPSLPFGTMYLMNIMVDIGDLSEALVPNMRANLTPGAGHCSLLVKVLPNNADLLVSHVTWDHYNGMTRILKKYDFDFGPENYAMPGRVTTFSGYPGMLYSGDDFHIMSPSNIVSAETTIGNDNTKLWKYVQPEATIFTGFRTILANRLSNSSQEWVDLFANWNSGTYNNEWIIVDYKKFQPGQELPDEGLMSVSDQLPGYIHSKDMSYFLKQNSYFPSYNIPFFEEVFHMGGSDAFVEKYGDWFTHDKNPRGLIFARDHNNVVDMDTMTTLMRYNKFQTDPLAACNCTPGYSGENAISARSDLNPANGTYPFSSLGHRNHGGTDMKTTSSSLAKKLQFVAVSGPTFDDQPVFKWSTSDFKDKVPHHGLPDVWNFEPEIHEWKIPHYS